MTTEDRVKNLVENTQDAYSFTFYGEAEWTKAAEFLVGTLGLSDAEAEAILRSKWTRWAGDLYDDGEGTQAAALVKFMVFNRGGASWREDLASIMPKS